MIKNFTILSIILYVCFYYIIILTIQLFSSSKMGNNCLVIDNSHTKFVLNITCKQYSKETIQQNGKPTQIITQTLQIAQDCILFTKQVLILQKNERVEIIKNSEIQMLTNQKDIKQKLLDITALLDIKFKISSICIGKKLFSILRKKNSNQTDIWYTLNQKKLIQKGDIFKIGQYRFHVLNIHLQTSYRFRHISIPSKYINKQKDKTCKICYEGDIYRENPLINPCLCTGSIKYIHIKCLKQQIKRSKAIMQTQYCYQIYKNKLSCTICKESYWDLFQKQILFITQIIKNKQGVFVELQIIQDYKKANSIIAIVDFGNLNQIQIGRSSKAQVRLNSDNVSRKHAKLLFRINQKNCQPQILLVDNNSMIGTYLQMKKEVEIKDFQQGNLQLKIGSEYIKLEKNIRALTENQIYQKLSSKQLSHHKSFQKIDKLIQMNADNLIKYACEKKFKSQIFPTQPQVISILE